MMRNTNSHLRVSESLVLLARYEVLSSFQVLSWRQRAKAVRMLIKSRESVPAAMEQAARRLTAKKRGTVNDRENHP